METNPLWLITGVDVLVQKRRAYFKMSQKIKKYLGAQSKSFARKRHFIAICVKRQKIQGTKNIFSLQNFVSEHIRFRCTLENFISFFKKKLNCNFYNRCFMSQNIISV
jgi:hypothetical protein